MSFLGYDFDDIVSEPEFPLPKGEPCRGLYFRGKVNNFIAGDGRIIYTNTFSPLKRKSCPGCPTCSYMIEELRERLYDKYFDTVTPECEDGALYHLQVTNISRDWESGIVDDWDIEFVRIFDGCVVNPVLSCVCNRGTKGCSVQHEVKK